MLTGRLAPPERLRVPDVRIPTAKKGQAAISMHGFNEICGRRPLFYHLEVV